MQLPTIYGLVLAGGKSMRMGRDKSLIVYHHKPQREHVFDLLQTCCTTAFTSCKTSDNVPAHLNPLPDAFRIDTPLNGILSALKSNHTVAWLTVPVDMPFIDREAIQFLTAHRKPEKIATCFYDSDGKYPEPLFTLWEPSAYPLLADFHARGNFSPREFLISHDVTLLKSPYPEMNTNINCPEDLELYLKRNTSGHRE